MLHPRREAEVVLILRALLFSSLAPPTRQLRQEVAHGAAVGERDRAPAAIRAQHGVRLFLPLCPALANSGVDLRAVASLPRFCCLQVQRGCRARE